MQRDAAVLIGGGYSLSSLFCSAEQKNNSEGNGRKWSGTQRRSGAETQTRHVRLVLVLFPRLNRGNNTRTRRTWRVCVSAPLRLCVPLHFLPLPSLLFFCSAEQKR